MYQGRAECHCCGGEEFKRNGKFSNRNRMVQRFQCLHCGGTYSETQPLDGVRIETDKAAMVVKMLAEGCGVRAIARLTDLNKNTVLNILETAGQHCWQFLDQRLVNLRVSDVEVDEVFGFVKTLEYHVTPENAAQYGDQYLFLAMERTSKLILNWEIGKRGAETAADFLYGLRRRISGHCQITTDGFKPYCEKQQCGVAAVFGSDADYGIEMKGYSSPPSFGKRKAPLQLEWIKRVAQSGNPDPAKMTVNHMERQNLNVRLFNRRFTRKTLGYSKCLRNHRLAVALQIAHFNFCRVHSAHKMTPAMAAGLTDHKWTVGELLAAPV